MEVAAVGGWAPHGPQEGLLSGGGTRTGCPPNVDGAAGRTVACGGKGTGAMMGSAGGGERCRVRPQADPTVEELKRNIDLLNYFYYLLSHPAASVPDRPRGGRAIAG